MLLVLLVLLLRLIVSWLTCTRCTQGRVDIHSWLAIVRVKESSTETSGRQADFGGETGCMRPEGRRFDLRGPFLEGGLDREEILTGGMYCVMKPAP
jgi:hypothetical protein